jgi:hypothetical protein
LDGGLGIDRRLGSPETVIQMKMKGIARRQLFSRTGRTAVAVVAATALLAGAGSDAAAGASASAKRDSVTAGFGAHGQALAEVQQNQPVINRQAYDVCASPSTYAGVAPTFAIANGYIAGWSNISKLDGSQPVGNPVPAFAQSEGADKGLFGSTLRIGADYYECGLVKTQLDNLDDNGKKEFPPVTSTFLAYGVVPVTATAYLIQAGPDPVTAVAYQLLGPPSISGNSPAPQSYVPYTVVATAEVSLRVSDVKADGVSLDVGPNCHTIQPLYTPYPAIDPSNPDPGYVMLAGGTGAGQPQPGFGVITSGGTVAGSVTIPPFTGCGVDGDNLDPLLDASVSGPGNYARLMEAALCIAQPGVASPYCTLDNLPVMRPFWTVSHGETFTGASSFLLHTTPANLGGPITCSGSDVAGNWPDTTASPRSAIGTFRWTGFSGCSGPGGSTWNVTQQGTAYFDPKIYDADGTIGPICPGTGTTCATIDGVSIVFQETSPGNCTFDLAGVLGENSTIVYYTNPPASTLRIQSNTAGVSSASSGCPKNLLGVDPAVVATYQLNPGTVTITSP